MANTILNWLLPFLVAPLTVVAGRLLLNAKTELDELPAWLKQIVVAAIAAGLVMLAKVTGAESLCGGAAECTIDNLDVKATVSALLAFVLHQGLKKR